MVAHLNQGNDMRLLTILVATAALAAAPALAEGPGRYAVTGAGPAGHDPYKGTATLSKTGEGTWSIRWQIGKDAYSGAGVGDGRVIAASFKGAGTSGTILFTANPDGSYGGLWAYATGHALGTETLVPQP